MHYVIIGGSAAGVSCIEGIRETDTESRITLISDEKTALYSRSVISYFLAGIINEGNIFFKKRDFFERNNVDAILGIRAIKIDLNEKIVLTADKNKITFDKLLIAAGAKPVVPEITGTEKNGVYMLRTIKDAKAIDTVLKRTRTAVILGGGLVGLRAAFALNSRGVIVKIITGSDRILSQMLDPEPAALMQKKIERRGISVLTGREVEEILGEDSVEEVRLDDGTKLRCDLIVIGKGVEPNIGLVEDTGIKINRGIVVDAFLKTNVEDVFAAGDVTERKDISSDSGTLSKIWPCAVEEGKTAGRNMAGKKTPYDALASMYSIEFFGLPVASMGLTRPKDRTFEEVADFDAGKELYKKAVLKDGIICGFLCVGNSKNVSVYKHLIANRVDVSKHTDKLLSENFQHSN